ncbi:hypothetical protein [Chryseobacterium shandongense]|uniref:hypothetical protein n=1 Tax=Chryseobacterium shandongense TaxID=1493872 RepID=UPI000F4E1CF0|nr:hypothetical protein [Chryseobacterium shandongense]AZA57035.1 hypothetical protein EG350_07525 [Chryseobacterium shandongense]
MKKFLITTLLFLGLSSEAFAQKHPPRPPAPPHPSRSQLYNDKARELDKKYNTEKRLILNHPLATKKMKNDQLKALNLRYENEKRLLRATR